MKYIEFIFLDFSKVPHFASPSYFCFLGDWSSVFGTCTFGADLL